MVVDSRDDLFFKQKTAYEVRISDWGSDVCSSDLQGFRVVERGEEQDRAGAQALHLAHARAGLDAVQAWHHDVEDDELRIDDLVQQADGLLAVARPHDREAGRFQHVRVHAPERSEEHTSELQSLMRISYAVFCLKKK